MASTSTNVRRADCARCGAHTRHVRQSGRVAFCPPCNDLRLATPPKLPVDRIIMTREECKLADVSRANRVRGTWVLVDVYADGARVAGMGFADYVRCVAALDMHGGNNRHAPSVDMWAELDAAAAAAA